MTVSVDPEVVAAAEAAVDAGRSSSVSAWVNSALLKQSEHDRGVAGWKQLIAEYEAEHGVITEEEMAAQQRADREEADARWAAYVTQHPEAAELRAAMSGTDAAVASAGVTRGARKAKGRGAA